MLIFLLQEKVRGIKERKHKKVKTEPSTSNYVGGEVIIISD